MQAKVRLIWILGMMAIAPLFPQENARWSRVIYRQLDLTKEANAPLYYMQAIGGEQSSLFTMLFRLLQDDAITAYEYLDGQERFTDKYRVDFKEFLDRFSIYYQVDNGNITVDDADIPSHEVLAYFLKEVYYFDARSSNFMVRPLALCPVLVRRDDLDNVATRYPLFWVPYAELEPHARKMPVMASTLNNSMNGTVDDFFRLRKYDGEIYKAGNPRNLAIAQYTSTPEEMKAEQERIEKELRDFEKGLWTDEDELIPAEPTTGRPNRRNTKTGVSRRDRRSASSSPGNSSVTMRDRRY
ncbi:MAG: gliding motility protein GldN [Bacteroidota bacterium]|nr:gliding motility protein GldN [Bacteroidota bacterium]